MEPQGRKTLVIMVRQVIGCLLNRAQGVVMMAMVLVIKITVADFVTHSRVCRRCASLHVRSRSFLTGPVNRGRYPTVYMSKPRPREVNAPGVTELVSAAGEI